MSSAGGTERNRELAVSPSLPGYLARGVWGEGMEVMRVLVNLGAWRKPQAGRHRALHGGNCLLNCGQILRRSVTAAVGTRVVPKAFLNSGSFLT